MPDPATLLLREFWYHFSMMNDVQSLPLHMLPMVLRNVERVADPLRGTVALRHAHDGSPLDVDLDSDADLALPRAWLQRGVDPLEPVPGAHPVLTTVFCDQELGHESYRVIQAVTTTDALDFTTSKLFLQRFRVPVSCEVKWIEIAFALGNGAPGGGGYGGQPGTRRPTIALLDLNGVPDPPPDTLPAPMAQAILGTAHRPMWQTHEAFTQVVNLHPGRDYGLLVDAAGTFLPGLRSVTGHEGINWTSAIYRLSERDTTAEPWRTREARALSFRLIGVPIAALDAPGVTVMQSLQLRAQPNPSHGAVLLTLRGARADLMIDVLDARGRRVAGGRSGGDRWLWPGTDAAGRPLPAGVYFIRARGNDGVAVSERVVLVR